MNAPNAKAQELKDGVQNVGQIYQELNLIGPKNTFNPRKMSAQKTAEELLDLPHTDWTKDEQLKHAVWGCFNVWKCLSDEECSQSRRRELFAHFIKTYSDQKEKDAYSAGLMAERILATQQTEQLRGEVEKLRKEKADEEADIATISKGLTFENFQKYESQLTQTRKLLDEMAEALTKAAWGRMDVSDLLTKYQDLKQKP